VQLIKQPDVLLRRLEDGRGELGDPSALCCGRLDLGGRRVKLTVWDTAGQERFRTLTSSYYRGAQGIVFVYDVTRRDTFEALERVWRREVDIYSNVEDAVKRVVANKVDLVRFFGLVWWLLLVEGSCLYEVTAIAAAACSCRAVRAGSVA
jgi:Ras-related protein Rab-18